MILIQSMYIAQVHDNRIRLSLIAGLLVLFSIWMDFILPFNQSIVNTISYLMIFAFFIYIVIILLRFLVRNKEVNLDTIYASISIYLLIGILGGFLFTAMYAFNPEAFSFTSLEEKKLLDFIYYSFVTMCTIGYGDIIPVTRETQTISFFMGIIGQLYLAIIVAILVGKYISKPQK